MKKATTVSASQVYGEKQFGLKWDKIVEHRSIISTGQLVRMACIET